MQLVTKLGEALLYGTACGIFIRLVPLIDWWWRAKAVLRVRERQGRIAGLQILNRVFPPRTSSWRLGSEKNRVAGLILFGKVEQAKLETASINWGVLSKRQIMALVHLGEALDAYETKRAERLSTIAQRLGGLPVIAALGPLDRFAVHRRIQLQLIECLIVGIRSQRVARALRRLGSEEGGLVRELYHSAAHIVDVENP